MQGAVAEDNADARAVAVTLPPRRAERSVWWRVVV